MSLWQRGRMSRLRMGRPANQVKRKLALCRRVILKHPMQGGQWSFFLTIVDDGLDDYNFFPVKLDSWKFFSTGLGLGCCKAPPYNFQLYSINKISLQNDDELLNFGFGWKANGHPSMLTPLESMRREQLETRLQSLVDQRPTCRILGPTTSTVMETWLNWLQWKSSFCYVCTVWNKYCKLMLTALFPSGFPYLGPFWVFGSP